jgi:hypothetical protein
MINCNEIVKLAARFIADVHIGFSLHLALKTRH